MSQEAVLKQMDVFFDTLGAAAEDRALVMNYVETGEGFEKVEDACKRCDTDHRLLAPLLKPIFEVILRLDKKSEEFIAAWRFYEYLSVKVRYSYSEDFYMVMDEFTSCGLTLKEAMMLDLMVTDFTPARIGTYHAFSYQCGVLKGLKSRNPARFAEIRDTLFSLPKELVTLTERSAFYFSAFMFGAMTADFTEDFAETLRRRDLIEGYIGKGGYIAVASHFAQNVTEYVYHYLCDLKKQAGGDEKKHAELLRRAERDIPYKYLLIGMCGYQFRDSTQEALNLLMRDTELMRRFFEKGNPYDFETETLAYLSENYFSAHPDDEVVALNALLFAGSKKIIGGAVKLVDARRKEWQSAFDACLKENPKLAKENAAAVKALTDKWADEDDGEKGFESFEAVEAYAATCKIQSAKLLASFDFSAAVLDVSRTKRVSETTLRVFLDKYFSMKEIYRNKKCDKMAAWFDRASFVAFIDGVYQAWQASDYDSKLKAAVIPYCFYTSNANLLRLKKQCVTLCDNNRHALTAYIISVMAMNGGKYALMLVDGIANKFPYAKAKQVARDAMAAAAAKYKIPVDVLGDMIIPTYDFDASGRRPFTYGGETYTLTLLAEGDLGISLGGKNVKAFPASTDEAARAAKKEFSDLKKDVKTLFKLQTVRLERALLTGRCWTYKDFKRYYLANPMMRGLVSRLVWGVYEPDGTLRGAFRYNLDGTTVNADYDEVKLSDGDVIALVHVCDLTGGQLDSWRAFVSDNEINQPFPQIGQKLCYPPAKYLVEDRVDLSAYDVKLFQAQKIVNKYNMTRLPVWDAGGYSGWYLEDTVSGYGVELTMDELYVGCDVNDGNNLKIGFYRPDGGELNDWCHTKVVPPLDVPTRISSTILSSVLTVLPEVETDSAGKTVKLPFRPFVNENDLEFEEPDLTPAAPAAAAVTAAADKKTGESAGGQTKACEGAASSSSQAQTAEAGLSAYLEFTDGTSNKFWQIAVSGHTHTVTFGRIGTAGAESVKEFGSEADATRDAEKLIASKIKKGYVKK